MSTKNRGFASLDRARQREIASQGGKAAHAHGTAHQWTSAEAKEAGRKGGRSKSAKKMAAAQARGAARKAMNAEVMP